MNNLFFNSFISFNYWALLFFFSFFNQMLFSLGVLKAETFNIAGVSFECASCKRVSIEGLEDKDSIKLSKEFCYHELEGKGEIVSCLELASFLLDLSLKNNDNLNPQKLISFLELKLSLNLEFSDSELSTLLDLIFLSSTGEEALLSSMNRLDEGRKETLLSKFSSKQFSNKVKLLWQKELDESILENFEDRLLLACSSKEKNFSNLFSTRKASLPNERLEVIKKLASQNYSKLLIDSCLELEAHAEKVFNFLEPCALEKEFKNCDFFNLKSIFSNLSNKEAAWLGSFQQVLALENSKILKPKDRILLLSQTNFMKRRTPMFHKILEESLRLLSSRSQEMKFNKKSISMLEFVSEEDEVIKELYGAFILKEKPEPFRIKAAGVLFLITLLFLIVFYKKFSKEKSSFERYDKLHELKEKEKLELLVYFEVDSNITEQDLSKNFKNKAKILHPDNLLTGDPEEFNLLTERYLKLQNILYG